MSRHQDDNRALPRAPNGVAELAPDPDSELTVTDPELARHLESMAESEPLTADALRTLELAVQRSISEERGTLSWLSSRPTWMRGAIGSLLLLVPVLMQLGSHRRPDFEQLPPLLMTAEFGVALAALFVGLAVVLRPLYRPPLAGWQVTATFAAATLIPIAFVVGPLHGEHSVSLVNGTDFWPRAIACFSYGLVLVIPALVLLFASDRRRHRVARTAILAAATAGLCANLALALHCPIADRWHILVGHVGISGVLISAYVVVHAARRRSREA